jgi:hypothetical protein
VWPAIVRPNYDVKLVYLDLNQWIALAKAVIGHRDGVRHAGALESARAAKVAGRAMFPLSGGRTTWSWRELAVTDIAPTSPR